MGAGIDRAAALELLDQHVLEPRMRKHSLASEAVLRAVAERLGEDPEAWGIAGLLHDLDIEITGGDPERHGQASGPILEQHLVSPEIVDAIRRHNARSSSEGRTTTLDHGLAAGEMITGLIVACALILPDRKLASVKAKSVVKRLKETGFAPTVDRASILECEGIGIDPLEFAAIALAAMQRISDELGL